MANFYSKEQLDPKLLAKRSVTPTELDNATHLNTVKTSGSYSQSSTVEALLSNGFPVEIAGILTVETTSAGTITRQIYYPYFTGTDKSKIGEFWTRSCYKDVWTEWVKVGSSLPPGVNAYFDQDMVLHKFAYVMSESDPGMTTVVGGEEVEVWWVQPTPPDPNAWVPKAPTFNLTGKSYTIPTDDGATYTVHGVATDAGTYFVTPPETVNVNAIPKAGYTFSSTAATAWSKVYEETPLAMDAAASSVSAPYYYRLDETDPTYKGFPKNRGLSSTSPWGGNANGFLFTYGQTPSAGVGAVALDVSTPGSRWWLDDSVELTSFSIAVAVNFQGSSPRFAITRDWNTKKRVDFFESGGAYSEKPGSLALLSPGIHHVGWTWDGTTIRVYVDGLERSNAPMASWGASAALVLFDSVVNSTTKTTSKFAGLVIDKNRAFSASEMKALSDAVTR